MQFLAGAFSKNTLETLLHSPECIACPVMTTIECSLVDHQEAPDALVASSQVPATCRTRHLQTKALTGYA